MPNLKISELTPLGGTPGPAFLFEVVDPNDFTMGPTGTNKSVRFDQLLPNLDSTYLRLDASNVPLTGTLDVTGNVEATGDLIALQAVVASNGAIIVGQTELRGDLLLGDPGTDLQVLLEPTTGPLNIDVETAVGSGTFATLYTLNETGTPANATDLATKQYVDNNAGLTVVGTPAQNEITIWDGPSSVKGDAALQFAGGALIIDGLVDITAGAGNNLIVSGGDINVTGDITATGNITGTLRTLNGSPEQMLYLGASNELIPTGSVLFNSTANPNRLDLTVPVFQNLDSIGLGQSTFFGFNISTNTAQTGNTIIGNQAGRDITSSSSNVLVGDRAGINLTTGGGNVAIGSGAFQNINAQRSVCIGQAANAGGSTVAIGRAVSGGASSVIIGELAVSQGTPSNSVILGRTNFYQTNPDNAFVTSATNVISIGRGNQPPAGNVTPTNQIVIGTELVSDGDRTMKIGAPQIDQGTMWCRNLIIRGNFQGAVESQTWLSFYGNEVVSSGVLGFPVLDDTTMYLTNERENNGLELRSAGIFSIGTSQLGVIGTGTGTANEAFVGFYDDTEAAQGAVGFLGNLNNDLSLQNNAASISLILAGTGGNLGLQFFNGANTFPIQHGGILTSTVPATASSAGVPGEMRSDGSHLYICTATNTWVRVAVATF